MEVAGPFNGESCCVFAFCPERQITIRRARETIDVDVVDGHAISTEKIDLLLRNDSTEPIERLSILYPNVLENVPESVRGDFIRTTEVSNVDDLTSEIVTDPSYRMPGISSVAFEKGVLTVTDLVQAPDEKCFLASGEECTADPDNLCRNEIGDSDFVCPAKFMGRLARIERPTFCLKLRERELFLLNDIGYSLIEVKFQKGEELKSRHSQWLSLQFKSVKPIPFGNEEIQIETRDAGLQRETLEICEAEVLGPVTLQKVYHLLLEEMEKKPDSEVKRAAGEPSSSARESVVVTCGELQRLVPKCPKSRNGGGSETEAAKETLQPAGTGTKINVWDTLIRPARKGVRIEENPGKTTDIEKVDYYPVQAWEKADWVHWRSKCGSNDGFSGDFRIKLRIFSQRRHGLAIQVWLTIGSVIVSVALAQLVSWLLEKFF